MASVQDYECRNRWDEEYLLNARHESLLSRKRTIWSIEVPIIEAHCKILQDRRLWAKRLQESILLPFFRIWRAHDLLKANLVDTIWWSCVVSRRYLAADKNGRVESGEGFQLPNFDSRWLNGANEMASRCYQRLIFILNLPEEVILASLTWCSTRCAIDSVRNPIVNRLNRTQLFS